MLPLAELPERLRPNEDCALTVSEAGGVRATAFATVRLRDDDGVHYDGTGTGGALATTVSDGETISWHSDGGYHQGDGQHSGFEICGVGFCSTCGHGSCGYTGGDRCEVKIATTISQC